LIKCLAIVSIGATPYLIATPEFHFNKPVRIGKRLARESGDIGLALLQYRLGLFKGGETTRRHNWRLEARFVYRAFDQSDQGHATTKWAGSVRENRRHAFVTAL